MISKLYTLPNCHTCQNVGEYLQERGIQYEEVNLSKQTGVDELRSLRTNYQGSIERDGRGIILPILVQSNTKGIEKVVQGEEILSLFKLNLDSK
jgi:glutaredoxin